MDPVKSCNLADDPKGDYFIHGHAHVRRPCHHPQRSWKHRHYMIGERRYCALECACGYVIDEGQVRYVR